MLVMLQWDIRGESLGCKLFNNVWGPFSLMKNQQDLESHQRINKGHKWGEVFMVKWPEGWGHKEGL